MNKITTFKSASEMNQYLHKLNAITVTYEGVTTLNDVQHYKYIAIISDSDSETFYIPYELPLTPTEELLSTLRDQYNTKYLHDFDTFDDFLIETTKQLSNVNE